MRDDEVRQQYAMLLSSIEGASAGAILLTLFRELTLHISGRGPCPKALPDLPTLKAAIAIERAHYRAMTARGEA